MKKKCECFRLAHNSVEMGHIFAMFEVFNLIFTNHKIYISFSLCNNNWIFLCMLFHRDVAVLFLAVSYFDVWFFLVYSRNMWIWCFIFSVLFNLFWICSRKKSYLLMVLCFYVFWLEEYLKRRYCAYLTTYYVTMCRKMCLIA